MKLLRDIPDDTPENVIRNILIILEEEATSLGIVLKVESNPEDIRVDLTVDAGPRFRLFASYVECANLHLASGGIGTGFVTSGDEHWDMELIPGSWATLSPPFHWQLSLAHVLHSEGQRTLPLDGNLLRIFLRNSLSSPPQQSQQATS